MSQVQEWRARVADAETRRYLECLRAVRRKASVSRVHALRTATRRLLALVALSAALDPKGGYRKLRAALLPPFKAAGRVRDLQLMQRVVGRYGRRHPEAEPLQSHLRGRLDKQQQRLARRVAGGRERRISRRLRALRDRAQTPAATPGSAAVARARLRRELERTRRTMHARSRSVATHDAASVHRARLAFKEHRYQLELTGALFRSAPSAPLHRLRQFQSALGAITDRTVLLQLIDAFVRRRPRRAASLDSYRRRIERERSALAARHLAELVAARRARSRASSRRS